MGINIINGDCLEELRKLPAESVHCVVTSPPYWGLRDYGNEGGIGLESTLQEHVEQIVAVFAEIWRVLRKDGTVWLNYGDAYAAQPAGNKGHTVDKRWKVPGPNGMTIGGNKPFSTIGNGLKPKDLCMLPARIAIALQDAGWWVRSEIIWAKPNPMPESVTDRPTSAHEKIYLLAKAQRYFYDAEAVRESAEYGGQQLGIVRGKKVRAHAMGREPSGNERPGADATAPIGRNIRNVWTVATAPYSQAHFATFPPALVEPCIKAGTSEKGVCGKCGAPWVREVGSGKGDAFKTAGTQANRPDGADRRNIGGGQKEFNSYQPPKTLGWSPSCTCDAEVVPATVLDPFGGAGTVGLVAAKLGRDAILIELSPEYCGMIERRLKAALLPTEGHSAEPDDHGPLFANV